MIQIISPENAARVNAAVKGLIMYSGEKAELIHLQLEPGDSLDLHMNPFDVVFYGLQGEAVLFTSETAYSLKTGDCAFVSSDEERGWRNESDKPFSVLVVKMH